VIESTRRRRSRLERWRPAIVRLRVAAVAMAAVAATACTLIILPTAPAGAISGFSAIGNGLALRTGPTTGSSVITRYSNGQSLDIECQTTGTVINGSPIWDKITGTSGFVADFFVNGTPYAQFDSRLPRCGINVQPARQAPAWTGHCAWPRCNLYLNRAASGAFANFAYTPSVPTNMYFAIATLFTATYRYIGKLWVDRGYCLAFQASAYPWETQGLYGYHC